MKRTLIIATLLTLTTACATTHSTGIGTTIAASTGGPIELGSEPTTVTLTRPAAQAQDAAPVGAEISDDPLVQSLATIFTAEDITTSLRINALWGDREMPQCTNWLQQPSTRQRVDGLLNVKKALQIAPIKTVGPVSVFAEKRRVQEDILSGAMATRVIEQRAKLRELWQDANLACAPLALSEKLSLITLFAKLAAVAKVVLP